MLLRHMLAAVVLLAATLFTNACLAQRLTDSIRLNQTGFYPDGPKTAVVSELPQVDIFFVVTPDFADTVYTGHLSDVRSSPLSNEQTRTADFSEVRSPGTYVLWIPDIGHSYQFRISRDVHWDAAVAGLKAFYFQRASTGLPVEYAGRWSRPPGHPDDHVLVHSSAATDYRPEGTIITAPKGWYDAGDYNKYIVNSGITMGTLFSLYEDFPDFMQSFDTDIPETGNGLPDVLNETLWNLRWMLDMQDPDDGGVYHKLTTAGFEEVLTPAEAQSMRYVVQKSTNAALSFAAVTAQAARIFHAYEGIVPGLADSCLTAAIEAWNWARENPDVLYNQRRMNEAHHPPITTGAYGGRDLADEFIWAASELYVTTGADSFFLAVDLFPDAETSVPTWSNVGTLAYYTLIRRGSDLTSVGEEGLPRAQERIVALADRLITDVKGSGYETSMTMKAEHYVWGSNAVAANQGIAMIQAYRITGSGVYLGHALANLDYLLGRNPTGYSFLTGHGSKTPLDVHHRPSAADGLREPVPGLLAGGPNPGQQDGCDYFSSLPALSYVDDWCSYASNEIAINWNAPFVYLAAALEALQKEVGHVVSGRAADVLPPGIAVEGSGADLVLPGFH